MPRAHRHVLDGRTYHVTHRCHDREFLLKFARDRDAYRMWLRAGLAREPVRCGSLHYFKPWDGSFRLA